MTALHKTSLISVPIIKFFCSLLILVIIQLAMLLPTAFCQQAIDDGSTSKQVFHFSEFEDLQGSMKEFFDAMNVWIETPRSPSAFKEAYASALSFKLALRAQIEHEKNLDFKSQMKALLPKISSVIGHLEEYIGTDLASKKIADVSLDIAVSAAKRDEMVQLAVAGAFATFTNFTTNNEVKASSEAFTNICIAWKDHGGPLDAGARQIQADERSSAIRRKHWQERQLREIKAELLGKWADTPSGAIIITVDKEKILVSNFPNAKQPKEVYSYKITTPNDRPADDYSYSWNILITDVKGSVMTWHLGTGGINNYQGASHDTMKLFVPIGNGETRTIRFHRVGDRTPHSDEDDED